MQEKNQDVFEARGNIILGLKWFHPFINPFQDSSEHTFCSSVYHAKYKMH